MDFFGKPKSFKDQQRQTDRDLRKVNRSLERDKTNLIREEKKLEAEIKKMAKEGNKEGCVILAKQLLQLRKQKLRTTAASGKVQGIAAQSKTMGANVVLANAMASTSKTMGAMNKIMQPQKLAEDMKAFQQANMKMEMSEEMINDTLDDIFADSDDEEQSDKIVTQVLDEIGIEISGQMAKAPNAIRGDLKSNKSRLPTDAEIEAELAKLKLPN